MANGQWSRSQAGRPVVPAAMTVGPGSRTRYATARTVPAWQSGGAVVRAAARSGL